MSTPPKKVRISPEEFSKEDQDVADKLANVLNLFLSQVPDALDQNLTFKDNFIGEVRSVKVLGGQSTEFKYAGKGKPYGVMLTSFSNLDNPSETLSVAVGIPQWSWDGRGSISIKPIIGFTSGDQYEILLVVLGE